MHLQGYIEKLKEFVKKENISFKKHAVIRMHQRNITADEIKACLKHTEIVEFYPEDYPLPSMLVLGYTKNERPIHVLAALDELSEMIWVITVYEPDLKEWKEGYRERRI